MAKTRGLKYALLRTLIPILFGSFFVITTVTALLNWYELRFTAASWMGNAVNGARAFLTEIARERQSDANVVLVTSPEKIGAGFDLGQSAYVMHGDDIVDRFPANAPCGLASSARGREGFVVLDGALVHIARATRGAREVVIVTPIGDEVIQRASRFAIGEVTLYVRGEAVATSYRNIAGQRVLPKLSADSFRRLQRFQGGFYFHTDRYRIPQYAGIFNKEGWGFRGRNEIEVVEGFEEIGEAVVGVSAPKEVLNSGLRAHLFVGAALFFIVSILTVLLVVYTAGRYLNPLTQAAREIEALSTEVLANVQEPAPQARDELGQLKAAVLRLSQRVEHERASRAQVNHSAKMAALGEMAAGIAHEINNPLAIICGKAAQMRDAICEGPVDTMEVSKNAERIEINALRISKIVKSLRAFAREGENDPFQATSLQTLVADVSELCRERFTHHAIDLDIQQIPSSFVLDCRASQISQVLLNLLNNSFDAVAELPEKWVRVTFRDLGYEVEISITDSGNGIPPELREKIFRPFFTTKDVGRGTGLGLSVSLGILRGHNGSLTIDEFNRNTRFILKLPKLQLAAVAAAA